ncbi:MAG: GNAT family N-acetyltransferase [Bacteroidia bacterium]
MEIILKTERLFLREVDSVDENDLFEMDSDPEVHIHIENNPVKHIDEIRAVIKMLQQQYKDNGIARWAVINNVTNECLGWAGLKYIKEPLNNHVNFYELGYRFKKKHWGKGYATEASKAIVNYGFTNLAIDKIYAITAIENLNSKKVLQKLNFEPITIFDYDGDLTNWFELKKTNWNTF